MIDTETVTAPPATMRAIATLQRLAELFAERRCQLAREAGLSVEQWRVLEEISEEHFMPSMFARERDCSAAAVSKVLRQLMERGLVEVSIAAAAGGGDGRRRRYALTTAGRACMGRLRECRRQAIEAVWGRLPEEDLEQFTDFGDRLAARMEEYAERSAGATSKA